MICKKHFLFIFVSWALIYFCSPGYGLNIDEVLPQMNFHIPREAVEDFYKSLELNNLDKLKNGLSLDASGYINADVNDFADQVMKNIGVYAVKNHLDPMPIDGLDQGFLTAHITLKNGSINGISTLSRNGNVSVKYSATTRIADLDIPIMFDNIGFSYEYYLVLFLIGPWGTMYGKIQNCKVFVCLSFDFNTYVASVKKLEMMDSGHASIYFVGGVIELVVDLLTEFLSAVLHPFIIAIIQGIVQAVSSAIVGVVNDAINGTFVSPVDAARNHTNITQRLFN